MEERLSSKPWSSNHNQTEQYLQTIIYLGDGVVELALTEGSPLGQKDVGCQSSHHLDRSGVVGSAELSLECGLASINEIYIS